MLLIGKDEEDIREPRSSCSTSRYTGPECRYTDTAQCTDYLSSRRHDTLALILLRCLTDLRTENIDKSVTDNFRQFLAVIIITKTPCAMLIVEVRQFY